MGPDWVQRWIGFTIVADALASQSLQGSPAFEFKGGAAIELRMRQLRRATGETSPPASDTPVWVTPRTTKDLDATYRGTLNDLEQAIRDALVAPRHQFAFRVESETPHAPFMRAFGFASGTASSGTTPSSKSRSRTCSLMCRSTKALTFHPTRCPLSRLGPLASTDRNISRAYLSSSRSRRNSTRSQSPPHLRVQTIASAICWTWSC